MGVFTDALRQIAPAETGGEGGRDTLPDIAEKGLRSGGLGAAAGLSALAGTYAESKGFNEFAGDRNADAKALSLRAQQAAPDIGRWQDINDVRGAADFVVGNVAQSAPSLATGLAAGLMTRNPITGLAVGTAAQTPMEAGDVALRNLHDPKAMQAPASERLRAQLLSGAGSAALQSVIPVVAAGKVLGRTAATAAKKSVGQIVGRGVADVGLEGVAEGAGEGLKQGGEMLVNPDRQFDTQAIIDNAVTGAAAGTALGAVGTAGELAQGRGQQAKNFVGSAAERAKTAAGGVLGKVRGVGEAVADAAGPEGIDLGGKASSFVGSAKAKAGEAVSGLKAKAEGIDLGDPTSKVADALKSFKDSTSRLRDRMAAGEEFGDERNFVGKVGDTLKNAMKMDDDGRVAQARNWTKEMWEGKMSEENRAKLQAAATNLGDKANQATVASMKRAKDMAGFAKTTLSALAEGFKARKAADGTKKSEDYAGVDYAVREAIGPWLNQNAPELLADNENINALAPVLRNVVTEMNEGRPLSVDTMLDLMAVTGDKSAELLDTVRSVIGQTDKDVSEKFFTGLNEMEAVREGHSNVVKVMQQSLPEGTDVPPHMLKQAATELVKWASTTKTTGAAQQKFMDSKIMNSLREHFGDKADKVLGAVQGAVRQNENALEKASVKTDEEGNPLKYQASNTPSEVEKSTRLVTHATGSGGGGYLNSHDEIGKSDLMNRKFRPAVDTALDKAREKVPGAKFARFGDEIPLTHEAAEQRMKMLIAEGDLKAEEGETGEQYAQREIGKYGVIVSEVSDNPLVFTKDELEAARLDTKKYSRSPSRVEVPNFGALDAVRLTELVRARREEEGHPTNTIVGRRGADAALFLDGMAALQEYSGKPFTIADDTVVSKTGMTWGELQKLDFRKDGDVASDADTEALVKLRKEFKAESDPQARAEIVREAAEITGRKATALAKEQTAEPDTQREDPMAKAELDPFGPTFQNGKGLDTITKGTGISTDSGEARVEGAGAPSLVGRARAAPPPDANAKIAWLDRQSQDLGKFRKLLQERTPEQIAAMQEAHNSIPEDSEFFAGRGGQSRWFAVEAMLEAAAQGGTPSPKALAAKQAAFLKKARSGDKALNEALKSSTDTKGLQRAAEALNKALELEGTKVVGDDGKPLRVYHGTTSEDVGGSARFFTSNPEIANDYALRPNKGGGNPPALTASYLDIKNPVPEQFLRGEDEPESAVYREEFVTWAKAQGYDGYMFEDQGSATGEHGGMNYVVFDRSQVKNAFDANMTETLNTINDRLSQLAADPDDAYGMLAEKYSMERTDPNATGPRDLKATFEYLKRVLGNSVSVDLNANIPHAGEFKELIDQHGIEDLINVSVHALNPLSVAHHEALHAFFAKLSRQGNGKIAGVLEQAASSPSVMLQLREFLKHSPEALRQLNNPEERAAYMYQAWAAGKLKLNQPATTFFGRVTEWLRSVMGVWSNDARAHHILDYFHSGEFAKNIGKPGHVADALMREGRNAVIERFNDMTSNIAEMGSRLAVAGHQRLRDTGVPALREMADLIKLQNTGEGDDPGFLPVSRQEHVRRMNDLAGSLDGIPEVSLNAAMESLQQASRVPIDALSGMERAQATAAAVSVRDLLDEMFDYMNAAGVKVNDLGVGKDYFPRVWDANYISSHQTEFLDMIGKYVASGEYRGDPKDLMMRLVAHDGAEFVVTERPGMQFVKPRELAFISAADSAEFVSKDLMGTLNSYVAQATRRAEWARRFGEFDPANPDIPTRMDELLAQARREGATPDDIDAAHKYLRSTDGTLGDDINPSLRRMQGNIMVYQNVRLLPLAIFSSVVDPIGIMVRGGSVGDAFKAFKRGITEIPKGLKGDRTQDADTELASLLGVIENATLMHSLGTSYTQGMVGDTGRKLNDMFFRFNLMSQFNTSMRVAATQAAISFIGKHGDGTATQHSKRWMAELGLQPGDVRMGADGRALVTEADGLTGEQAATMRMAINRWVDGAVLRPDAADKPIWMSDPRWALVSHLKQFVFSFQETILKRVVHEFKAGNMTAAYALASYVPVMIAADAAKGIITSGGEGEPAWKRAWGPAEYVGAGIERGGLLGSGQFVVDMLRDVHRGGTGVGALTGPTIDQFAGATQVVAGRREFDSFVLKSMPANALYAGVVRGGGDEAPARAATTKE